MVPVVRARSTPIRRLLMHRIVLRSATLLLVLAACGESTAPTQPVTPLAARSAASAHGEVLARSTEVVPFQRSFYNSCTGESVLGSGELHMTHTVTRDADGGERELLHINPRGVTGVGQLSGDQYRMVGGETRISAERPDGDERTSYVQIMRLVSASSGENLSLQLVLVAHVADGVRAWEVESSGADCRG